VKIFEKRGVSKWHPTPIRYWA